MRFVKLLFFLSFLSPTVLRAQTIFLKGYYITVSKDTVKGYIEYRGTDKNFNICAFRSEPGAREVELSAKEIAGYVVEDKAIYESHLVTTKKAVEQQVFLQIITTGKLSLLRYENSYYARNLAGEIFDISKRRVVKDNTSKDENRGVGMLKTLMADCKEMTGTYIETKYTSGQHLPEIFKEYNTCVGSLYEKRPVPSTRLFVRPGLQASGSMSWLRLKGTFTSATFDSDQAACGGAFISLLFPKMGERFRLVIEATYDQASHYSFFTETTDIVDIAQTVNDVFVDYSRLRVPVFFRFEIKPLFFDFGLQNQFILTQDTDWRVETSIDDVINTKYTETVPFNTWSNGIIGAVGVKFHVLDRVARSSIRYSQTNDLFHNYKPVFRTLELTLSLELKKY